MESNSDLSPAAPRLPFLVLELLVEYLDFYTLQTLRLVCRKAKTLVEETSENLRHFVVRITGEARLDEVLDVLDPVPWNSFAFRNSISSACIQRFLAAYGDLVLHLELDWDWRQRSEQSEEYTLRLLSGCPQLESVCSKQLIFAPIQPNHSELTRRLLDNWTNLRHFHVQHILGDPGRPLREMIFFSQMLSRCTQLETLTIPYFSFLDQPMMDVGYAESFECLVGSPLLDAIGEGRLRSVTVPHGRINDELLLRVAIACRESGTVLYAESSTFLRNLSPAHLSVLDIIGNLYGITDTIIRRPLTNVRSIRFVNPTFRVKNDTYTMPSFPHLSDLEFDLKRSVEVGAWSWNRVEIFLNRLVKVKRPTVRRLRVTYLPWHSQVNSVYIRPMDLCASFVNLRVLHVNVWKGKDAEWLQVWPLVGNTLVELELQNCSNLTDRGILGNDHHPNLLMRAVTQPAFLQLKHLRKLTLITSDVSPGRWKITELSFMYAFCHMRLRSFIFFEGTVNRGHSPRRFSAEAVQAMWNGPFGESIEEFVLQGTVLTLNPKPFSGANRRSESSNPESGIPEREVGQDGTCRSCRSCCSIM